MKAQHRIHIIIYNNVSRRIPMAYYWLSLNSNGIAQRPMGHTKWGYPPSSLPVRLLPPQESPSALHSTGLHGKVFHLECITSHCLGASSGIVTKVNCMVPEQTWCGNRSQGSFRGWHTHFHTATASASPGTVIRLSAGHEAY